jgi:hypothetical protein
MLSGYELQALLDAAFDLFEVIHQSALITVLLPAGAHQLPTSRTALGLAGPPPNDFRRISGNFHAIRSGPCFNSVIP